MSDELNKDNNSDTKDTDLSKSAVRTGSVKKSREEEKRKNIVVEQYEIFKSEFKKIIWPTRHDLVRQTITVIVISLMFGAYISLTDGIFAQLFQQFVKLLG